MSHPGKRARHFGPAFRVKRQVEKVLKAVNLSLTGAVQGDTPLFTATDPVTLTGLHWSVNADRATDATVAGGKGGVWAIIISRQGIAVTSLNGTNGADVYTPEEQCIVASNYSTSPIAQGQYQWVSGSTKSMRKLKCGDTVHFIAKGLDADGDVNIGAVITFFTKH